MYKSNIITQALFYLMITLTKQRDFVGKSDMIYDCPSETVLEQFFGSHFVVLYNYKAVRHILQSVYFYMPLVKQQYQPICPFLPELRQKKPPFYVYNGGTLIFL